MNSRAALIGFGYQLWCRTRWMLLATLGQIIVLVAAVHLLGTAHTLPLVGAVLMSFMGITIPYFVQAFTYGGDFSSMESGLPHYMMVLPLGAGALTTIPMLYATGFMAMLWLVVGEFVLVPLGMAPPTFWSTLVPMTVVAWLCAIAWTPFWFPFGRVIASIGVLSVITAFTATARTYAIPEWITSASLLGATVVAFATAIGGVARARRGDGTVPPWRLNRAAGARPAPVLKPFASPERAQIWFELRRNCTLGACFVLGSMTALAIPLLWESNQHIDLLDFYFVPIPYLPTAIFLIAPVILFATMGGNFGRPDAWKDSTTAPAFLTARPMSDTFIIVAKLKATTLTIVFIWAFVFGLIGLSMLIPQGDPHAESLTHFLLRHATPRHVLLIVVLLVGLVLQSWLTVVKSFSLNLYGGKWIPMARMFATIVVIATLPYVGHWVWVHPDRRAVILLVLRISMGVLVAAKIGVAIPIIRAILRNGVSTSARVISWTALWFLAVAVLVGITLWLAAVARHSIPLIAGVVLLLPYNRMISMPLAWHHNRHR